MKSKLTILLIEILMPLSLFGGGIKGIVRDAATGEKLIAASVSIKGSTIGTTTDLSGRYYLNFSREGKATIVVSYIGYVTQEVEFTFGRNQVLEKDFELNASSFEMEEVVVSVQAKGQFSAINQQLNANSISNIVSAEKIRELPDANVVESLARLPGVSIESADGEGSKVIVRGMQPRYNLITVNGVRAPATSHTDNSVSMAGVSPFMVDGIEVQKSLTPDKDADVVGGIVDLKLKDADPGFHVNALVQNRFAGELGGNGINPLATLQISNRFFDNKLGVIAVGNFETVNRISHQLSNEFSQVVADQKEGAINRGNSTFTHSDINRQRSGLSVFADYTTDDLKITASGFVNALNDEFINRSNTIASNAILSKGLNIREGSTLSQIYSLAMEKSIFESRLKVGVSYNRSDNESPINYFVGTTNSTFNANSNMVSFDSLLILPNVSPYQLGKEINDLKNNPEQGAWVSDSAYYINSFSSTKSIFIEEGLMLSLDYEIPFNISRHFNGMVKLGGKYTSKIRDYDVNSFSSGLTAGAGMDIRDDLAERLVPGLNFSDPAGLLSGSDQLAPYNLYDNFKATILDDGYTLGGFMDPKYARQILSVLDADGWSKNAAATDNPAKYGGDYSGSESTTAGYFMADINLTRFVNLVGGVRYENIQTDYSSWGVRSVTFITSVLDTLPDDITVRNNAFWLPMINAKIIPFKWMDIRLAYTQSIARPQYTSFMPRYMIDRDGNLSGIGNPVLRPALSENMDVYVSFHGNKVGLFTMGAFVKRIEGFEYSRQFNKDNPLSVEKLKDILLYPALPKDLGTLRSVGRINVNNDEYAYVKGVELDLQTTFWYLPAPLNGLIFSTNYTYSESEQTETRELVTIIRNERGFPINTEYRDSTFTTPLVGQPKHIYNASMGYDYKTFSARLSYRYTAQSFTGFVKAQTQLPEDKRLKAAYKQWDLAITQDIPWVDGLDFFFNATRFTNEIEGDFVELSDGFNIVGSTPEKSVAQNNSGRYPLQDRQYSNFLIFGLKYQF